MKSVKGDKLAMFCRRPIHFFTFCSVMPGVKTYQVSIMKIFSYNESHSLRVNKKICHSASYSVCKFAITEHSEHYFLICTALNVALAINNKLYEAGAVLNSVLF